MRIAPDGQSFTEIAEPDLESFNLTAPDINAAGDLAWIAQLSSDNLPTTHGVFVGNGGTPERRLELSAAGGSSLGPDINNSGAVVGYQPNLISAVGPDGDPADPANVIRDGSALDGFVSFVANNDFGQVAYVDDSGLYVDDIQLLDAAGSFNNEPVSVTFIRDNVSFNNNGQVIAVVRTGASGPFGAVQYAVRFDPEGATPSTPLKPFASTPDGENDVTLSIVNGLGVDAPIWVDPIVATGFVYTQGPGGANFASLILPETLPLGDDLFTLTFELDTGEIFSGEIGLGDMLDFTELVPLGIASFTLSGIDPGAGVDPTDPFVVGLTFVEGGFQSVLSIDAITLDTDGAPTAPVPLPASLPLGLGGLAMLGWVARRPKSASGI